MCEMMIHEKAVGITTYDAIDTLNILHGRFVTDLPVRGRIKEDKLVITRLITIMLLCPETYVFDLHMFNTYLQPVAAYKGLQALICFLGDKQPYPLVWYPCY